MSPADTLYVKTDDQARDAYMAHIEDCGCGGWIMPNCDERAHLWQAWNTAAKGSARRTARCGAVA